MTDEALLQVLQSSLAAEGAGGGQGSLGTTSSLDPDKGDSNVNSFISSLNNIQATQMLMVNI